MGVRSLTLATYAVEMARLARLDSAMMALWIVMASVMVVLSLIRATYVAVMVQHARVESTARVARLVVMVNATVELSTMSAVSAVAMAVHAVPLTWIVMENVAVVLLWIRAMCVMVTDHRAQKISVLMERLIVTANVTGPA